MNTTNLLLIAGVGAGGWLLLGAPTDIKGFKDGIDKLLGKKPASKPASPPPPPPIQSSPPVDMMDPSMEYPPIQPQAPFPMGGAGPASYGDPNLQFDSSQQAMTQGQGMMSASGTMGTPAGATGYMDPSLGGVGGAASIPGGALPQIGYTGVDPMTGMMIQTPQLGYPGYLGGPPYGPVLSTPPLPPGGVDLSTGAIAPGNPFGDELPPSLSGINVGQSQALPGGPPIWDTGVHPGMAVPGDLGGPDPGIGPIPVAGIPLPPPPLPIPIDIPPPVIGGGGGHDHDHDGGFGGGGWHPGSGGSFHRFHHDWHPGSGGHHSHFTRSMLGLAETAPRSFITPYNPSLQHGRCVPFFKSIPELMTIDIGGIVVGLDRITLAHLVSLGTGTGVEIFPDGIDACDMPKFKNDIQRYCRRLMKNMSGHTPAERADMLRQIIMISAAGPITPFNQPKQPTKNTHQNMMSRVPIVPSNSPPGVSGPVYRSNAGFILPAKSASLQFNNGANSMPPMLRTQGRSSANNSLFFDLSH